MTHPQSDGDMKIDPLRATALIASYRDVAARVADAARGRPVRILAISKLKPATDILALYESEFKVRHFGENYAQELFEKARLLPGGDGIGGGEEGIMWHFVGGLQTNKCKPLASTLPNLFCVSSVDTSKKATQLSLGRSSLLESHPELFAPTTSTTQKLNIHIQINTSSEASKSGVTPGPETTALVKHVLDSCPHLHLLGFMTIGAIARSQATTPETENEDIEALRKERNRVARELGRDQQEWELSMGMSGDFEAAVRAGSDEVRVGSTIFGERPRKEDFKVKEGVEEGKG